MEKMLHHENDVAGDRSLEKAECPKDTLGCSRGRVKFMWKNWPLMPRPTPSMPPEHLTDGCQEYGDDVRTCFLSFFGNCTDNDVLIVGSNYAFTSTMQYGTEEEALATAEQDIPASVEILLETFPGTILYHSLGPVQFSHERLDEHRWIPLLNNITKRAVASTRIVYIDTYGHLLDKRPLFEDVIHHPGRPSEDVVNMFLEAAALQRDSSRLLAAFQERWSRRCQATGWADEYIAFHRNALLRLKQDPLRAVLEEQIKVLVFRPFLNYNQGFADRLAGLEKAFLIAYCSNRVFLVDWPALQSLFQVSPVDWRYEPAFWEEVVNCVANGSGVDDGGSSIIEYINDEFDTKPVKDYIKQFSRLSSVPLTSIHFNRAASKETLATTSCGSRLKEKGITDDNLFGCAIGLLLVPKNDVLQPHTQILAAISTTQYSVGAQIRNGDHVFDTDGDQAGDLGIIDDTVHALVQRSVCFKPLIDEGGSKPLGPRRIFLMTDSARLRERAIVLYPTQFYVTNILPKHVAFSDSTQDHHDIIAEWYLFSMNEFHVLDRYSGLGRTSYAYALTEYPAFFRQGTECLARTPADLGNDGAMLRQ